MIALIILGCVAALFGFNLAIGLFAFRDLVAAVEGATFVTVLCGVVVTVAWATYSLPGWVA